jgi:hypothetical protein
MLNLRLIDHWKHKCISGSSLDWKMLQDVHIAVGPEIVAQYGPEQRQAPDVMPLAEVRERGLADLQRRTHNLTVCS